jgi:ferric-dicitrate binding protein FerR (iron transport regulator)
MRELTEEQRNRPVIAMHGPETQWEHELHSVSREGLASMVRTMNWMLSLYFGSCDHADMLKFVREAKQTGRHINAYNRIERMLEDPHGEAQKWMRRRRAAKKAARARKRARKANA